MVNVLVKHKNKKRAAKKATLTKKPKNDYLILYTNITTCLANVG